MAKGLGSFFEKSFDEGQFVQQMLDVVAVGRFTPRKYDAPDAKFIECDTREAVCGELQKLSEVKR